MNLDSLGTGSLLGLIPLDATDALLFGVLQLNGMKAKYQMGVLQPMPKSCGPQITILHRIVAVAHALGLKLVVGFSQEAQSPKEEE